MLAQSRMSLEMPTALSVNVNKIALLRNQRPGQVPDVLAFSRSALAAGAAGITVHPRPDERHIRKADVFAIGDMLSERDDVTDWTSREFNIEGNPLLPHLLPLIRAVQPDQATFVPDSPGQSTSDHGFDLARDGEALRPVIQELKTKRIRVSLFMDPVPKAMAAAKALGADRVELYTEPYAKAFGKPEHKRVLQAYAEASRAAHDAGLKVNAGHDLSLDNLGAFLEGVPHVAEVSIGHALVAECLHLGVGETVRRYLKLCGA